MLAQTNPSPNTIAAVLPDGFVVPYVEVAATEEARRRGLVGRVVGLDQGMVFEFGRRGQHPMHMLGCIVPLDIIWLDDRGRVIKSDTLTAMMQDWDHSCMSWNVLELAAGQASAHGVVPGSQIRFTVTP
jgi:uncharacterized protein